MSFINNMTRYAHLLKRTPIIYRAAQFNPKLGCLQQTKPNQLISYDQIRFLQTKPPNSDDNKDKKQDDQYRDPIKYTIKFKELDVKKVIKEFYSFYGPLFIVCHIGVSLASLGFFCSLVWLTVDPIKYIPEQLLSLIGKTMASMTEGGSKFIIAYAIHKIILPLRLGGTILLTRYLAPKLKLKWKPQSK